MGGEVRVEICKMMKVDFLFTVQKFMTSPVAVKLRLASVPWQTAPRTSPPQERCLGSSSQEVPLGASHLAANLTSGEVGLTTHHQVGEAEKRLVFTQQHCISHESRVRRISVIMKMRIIILSMELS